MLSILALAMIPLSLIVSALVMLAVQTPTVSGARGMRPPPQPWAAGADIEHSAWFSSISRAGVFTLLGCIGISLVLALIAILRYERPRLLSVTAVVLVIVLVAQFAGNQYQHAQLGQDTGAPR